MDGQTLLTAFLMLLGTGVFLRIVAKEKRRREKHLELRVLQHNQAVREREQRMAAQAAHEAAAVATPAELTRGEASSK
jgi:hypothetical protein